MKLTFKRKPIHNNETKTYKRLTEKQMDKLSELRQRNKMLSEENEMIESENKKIKSELETAMREIKTSDHKIDKENTQIPILEVRQKYILSQIKEMETKSEILHKEINKLDDEISKMDESDD